MNSDYVPTQQYRCVFKDIFLGSIRYNGWGPYVLN